MASKKIRVIKTKTYNDSLYKLRDPSMIVSIEKKVNKLLENPDIAKPMKYQHGGFYEIPVGSGYRVYCVKIEDDVMVVFLVCLAVDHAENFGKSKEYRKLFEKLKEIKDKEKV